uniref:Putative methyltransferase n=1 Tax=viral metagenome TaxID=1070528 RepID=A0A6H1ZS06_9ZZZZ
MCGSADVVKVLDFGKMPLANAFLKDPKQPEAKYPLRVYFCRDCTSVQLLDIVDPAEVYTHYDYLTSASKPLADHFTNMGNDLCDEFITSNGELMVEIGGNDGVLLDAVKNRCRVLNIDPSEQASKISREKNIPTVTAFFNSKLAGQFRHLNNNAKVVVANNVMAHIPDIRDVLEGVKNLLVEDGVFVFEVHWLGNLITTGGFDQIYHEHIYYHSLTALKRLVESVGLKVFNVELVPIHGESLRVFVARTGPIYPHKAHAFMDREQQMGLNKEETYTNFSDKIARNKRNLVELCRMLRREKKSIVGYGAPAKGNTLLNYYQLPLDYLTDTTPLKQGLYSPGMHIKVSPPERLLKDPPDYALLLAWNYADAILAKEKHLMDLGTKFIIPVPTVQIA